MYKGFLTPKEEEVIRAWERKNMSRISSRIIKSAEKLNTRRDEALQKMREIDRAGVQASLYKEVQEEEMDVLDDLE